MRGGGRGGSGRGAGAGLARRGTWPPPEGLARTGLELTPGARPKSPPWQKTTREAKSRIKELWKNCIVGGAPPNRKAELQVTAWGQHPHVVLGAEPATLQLPWGSGPLSEDHRHTHTRTHTCTHTHIHTHSFSLAGSWIWNRSVLPAGQKASPFGFTDSRSLQVLSGSRRSTYSLRRDPWSWAAAVALTFLHCLVMYGAAGGGHRDARRRL